MHMCLSTDNGGGERLDNGGGEGLDNGGGERLDNGGGEGLDNGGGERLEHPCLFPITTTQDGLPLLTLELF